MDAFQSIIFTYTIMLSVWFVSDIIEDLQDLHNNTDNHAANRPVMDELTRARFFYESIQTKLSSSFYH